MEGEAPLATVTTARQVPKWSELRQVVQFRRPQLGRTARRLENALTVRDLRAAARRTTPRAVFDYVDGAAEEEITAARNVAAYRRIAFRPDALRSVAEPEHGRRGARPAPRDAAGLRAHRLHADDAPPRRGGRGPRGRSTSACRTRSRRWAPPRSRTCAPPRPAADLWFQVYYTSNQALNEMLVDAGRGAGLLDARAHHRHVGVRACGSGTSSTASPSRRRSPPGPSSTCPGSPAGGSTS